MPINTDLNIAPYFDDFDSEKQFYRILFKPGYAVQARELTQLQSMLQNQVATFGDNVFKEGSIVKGITFTELSNLKYVKLNDKDTGAPFTPTNFISRTVTEEIGGIDTEVDIVYEVETQNLASGDTTKLKAKIIQASTGFVSKNPDLQTFYINYLNETETGKKEFTVGEPLNIIKKRYIGDTLDSTEYIQEGSQNFVINVATGVGQEVGSAFGIQSSAGIIFQKGNFIFAEAQTVVVEKYSNSPNAKSIGFEVTETLVTSLQDPSLFDNANGSTNENAPGGDRLKLTPNLVVKTTTDADEDADFFSLIRYVNGNAVQVRDVSQYNALGDEMARRTFEESGNYIVERFKVRSEKRGSNTEVIVSPGVAYVKGYRVENAGEQNFTIDNVSNTEIFQAQPVSINYGSYVDVDEIRGTVDIDGTEADLEEAGTVIGKTFIRNLTQDRVYLYGSRITSAGKSFADVTQIDSDAGRILISNNAVIREQSRSPMIFPTGVFSVKSTSDIIIPVRERISASITSGTITLNNNGGVYNYDVNNDDVVVIDNTNVNRTVTSAVSSSNDSVLTISVSGGDAACTVYVNRNFQQTNNNTPYGKQVRKPYIKVAFADPETKYSLGFPDVWKIYSVEDSNGVDFTNSFRLHSNQKDGYYDISFMEYIPGRPKPANGTLTINLGTFQLNTSTGKAFFSINSYPIDDDSATLPNDKIRSHDLQVYTGTNGINYNLRECIDFRPYADKAAAASYSATTPASAPTITEVPDGVAPTFTTSMLVPALNESMVMDIESYNARMDLLTVDSYGTIALVKGNEEQDPSPPRVSADKLVISEVFIPGRPALSAYEADRAKKPAYAIRTRSRGIKRSTMADIATITDRIDRMEYYISLNQLEQSVDNINVLDENGLNRFKNGYLAEPFNDLTFAEMEDPLFDAAVPFDKKIMTPPVISFPIDLKYKSSSSATLFPTTTIADVGTLSRNSHVEIIDQPFATAFRNCVSNFYQYNGVGELSPSHDFGMDHTVNPVPAVIDLTTPFQDFADAIQEFLPLTGTRVTGETLLSRTRSGRTTTSVFEQTIQTNALEINEGTDNAVGDFVTNVGFLPFIRPKQISIFIAGLRPNTDHYFYFDGQAIDQHVYPGTAEDNARNVATFGEKGDTVTTDSDGVLRAVFEIPSETFYVGERKLEVADVDAYDTIESAGTSTAKLSYHAYNVSMETTSLQTRVPEIDVGQVTTTRNVTRRFTERRRRGDPLAQTFFIKKGMGLGSDTVMISKVDLYFKRKSATNGVNIQLREVVNGYPSNRILAFGQVHLKPSQVSVSDDASVATTVDFEAPVRLETETEYAVVVKPDANDPDYLIFTSKVGGLDLSPGATNGQAVVQDWGDGVLFTSTNNQAWKSYQDEDIKFKLYRHNFNASSGSLTLTNNDHEFFTLSDWDGKFQQGEFLYQERTRASGTGATVSMALNTKVITGTALDDTYAAGDYIKIENSGATREDIFQIVSVDSASQMTADKPTSFVVSNGAHTPLIAGRVTLHDQRHPEVLHIAESSASTGKVFQANTVYGLVSGVEAEISTVDDINLSYIQPIINRTNDSDSRATLSGTFVDTNNTNNYYDKNMKFGDANHFVQNGVVLYSKSNNVSGTKPFDFTINMENGGNVTSSPFVDIETSMLIGNQYRIGNTDANSAKYISKIVELAEDLDAEDLRVYVSAYKPKGTDVKVYMRPQHAYDSSNFASNDWIELEVIEGLRAESSTSNVNDYREFIYAVPDSEKNADGALTYESQDGGDFVGYRKFAIRIDLLSPNIHQAPTVADFRAIALT